MASISKTTTKGNIFLRMHPLQRVVLSLCITAAAFFILWSYQRDPIILSAELWVVFSISYIITNWIIFFTMPVAHIEKMANKEDGSRIFVLISILVSSFASMFTVLLLMVTTGDTAKGFGNIILIITGIMSSWTLLHTIFTLHYAHLYYNKTKNKDAPSPGLDFPGEEKPDYIDFAYFSFVIGMTFQVSDVQINSRIIRSTALAHGLLSFALNTFVVALTINLLAGLSKCK